MKIFGKELTKNRVFGFLGGTILLGLVGFLIFYCGWVNFVENYEYGFVYNKFTGQIEPMEHTGWVVVTPWCYDVHKIDTRPYQVSISANQRVLNAKLVRFNPDGLNKFVEWHGRAAGDEHHNLLEILKCYAFDRDEGQGLPLLDGGKRPVSESGRGSGGG